MLVATPQRLIDDHVFDLTTHLRPGDRLVLNDTKVIPARLFGKRLRTRPEGLVSAKIEVTLLEPGQDGAWSVLAKPLRKLTPGDLLEFAGGLGARVLSVAAGQAKIAFAADGAAFEAALDAAGTMPLPPYIAAKRAADDQDRTDYQTVWAKNTGAVAAPTASLHFDDALLAALAARGVEITHVTLHVGAGTFLPVKVENVEDHRMHSEWGQVTEEAAEQINATKAAGGRVIPVGTTALRLIETVARDGQPMRAWEGGTDIFIYPGFKFHVADALMTNFHLPKSTLMMLVSAFMGVERIEEIYAHAIASEYRFFSYGDASLLLPSE